MGMNPSFKDTTWTNLYFNPRFSSAEYYKTHIPGFEASDFITVSLELVPLGPVENEILNDLTWQFAFLALLIYMKKAALPCQAHMDQQCWQLVKSRDIPLRSPSVQLWLSGSSSLCTRTSQKFSKPAFAKVEVVTGAPQVCQVTDCQTPDINIHTPVKMNSGEFCMPALRSPVWDWWNISKYPLIQYNSSLFRLLVCNGDNTFFYKMQGTMGLKSLAASKFFCNTADEVVEGHNSSKNMPVIQFIMLWTNRSLGMMHASSLTTSPAMK